MVYYKRRLCILQSVIRLLFVCWPLLCSIFCWFMPYCLIRKKNLCEITDRTEGNKALSSTSNDYDWYLEGVPYHMFRDGTDRMFLSLRTIYLASDSGSRISGSVCVWCSIRRSSETPTSLGICPSHQCNSCIRGVMRKWCVTQRGRSHSWASVPMYCCILAEHTKILIARSPFVSLPAKRKCERTVVSL